jgi:hypothetical protein
MSALPLKADIGLSRFESSGFVSQGFDKLAYAVAGQRVIIDDRDQWNFGHASPGRNVSRTKTVTKPQLIFEKFDLGQLADGYAFFAWRSLTSTVIGAESGIGPPGPLSWS